MIKNKLNQEEQIQNAMKRIQNNECYLKEAFVFKEDISIEKIKIYGLLILKPTTQDLEEIFFQNLLETNQFLDKFPLIVYKDHLLAEREVMTDLLIPQINVTKQNQKLFFMNILAMPSLNPLIAQDKLLSTRLFTYQEGKRISISETMDCFQYFSDPKNYRELLNMLLNYLKNCQIESTQQSTIPQYLPSKLQEYYQEWLPQKESFHQKETYKEPSHHLKRILKK